MERESSNGLMELNILENGEKIVLMAKVNLSMWMEISTMASGRMIRQTGMEYISTSMALSMKVNGKMIYSMVKEWKLGLMDQNMMVIMLLAENME